MLVLGRVWILSRSTWHQQTSHSPSTYILAKSCIGHLNLKRPAGACLLLLLASVAQGVRFLDRSVGRRRLQQTVAPSPTVAPCYTPPLPIQSSALAGDNSLKHTHKQLECVRGLSHAMQDFEMTDHLDFVLLCAVKIALSIV